jgi:hypothetical protein
LIAEFVGDLPAWLVTITHKSPTYHAEQSARIRRHFLHRLNRDIFGCHYDRRGEGLLSFFAFELQRRGTVHQHGIVAGEGLLSQRRSVQNLFLASLAKGFCRSELPRNQAKTIRYCAKYAAKDGEVDVWLPRGLKLQRELAPGAPGYRREVVAG